MTARRKQSFEERIAEYVDSPLLVCRIRHGKRISAHVHGRHGFYRTQVHLTRKLWDECTCPSEIWPCKHTHALHETWNINPDSFFDLTAWLGDLSKQRKSELIEVVAKMVFHSPTILGLFDIPGFEVEDDDEYYEEELR